MQLTPIARAVANAFPPDVRYGPSGGCPFCGIQFGHIEGCTSPNAAISKLPLWPRMKQHLPTGEHGFCARCGRTTEWLTVFEVRPIYGDTEIKPCTPSGSSTAAPPQSASG